MRKLDKIEINSFDGAAEVLGARRRVAFAPEENTDHAVSQGPRKGTLVITDLTLDEAVQVIDHLRGNPIEVVPAPPADAKPANGHAAKATVTTPVKATDPVDEILEEEDMDEVEASKGLDFEFLGKQEKLRPIIEHMAKHGAVTIGDVVRLANEIVDKVPALQVVQKKGSFDRRMEQAATVVFGGDKFDPAKVTQPA